MPPRNSTSSLSRRSSRDARRPAFLRGRHPAQHAPHRSTRLLEESGLGTGSRPLMRAFLDSAAGILLSPPPDQSTFLDSARDACTRLCESPGAPARTLTRTGRLCRRSRAERSPRAGGPRWFRCAARAAAGARAVSVCAVAGAGLRRGLCARCGGAGERHRLPIFTYLQ